MKLSMGQDNQLMSPDLELGDLVSIELLWDTLPFEYGIIVNIWEDPWGYSRIDVAGPEGVAKFLCHVVTKIKVIQRACECEG